MPPLTLCREVKVGKAKVGLRRYYPWIGQAMANRLDLEEMNSGLRIGHWLGKCDYSKALKQSFACTRDDVDTTWFLSSALNVIGKKFNQAWVTGGSTYDMKWHFGALIWLKAGWGLSAKLAIALRTDSKNRLRQIGSPAWLRRVTQTRDYTRFRYFLP